MGMHHSDKNVGSRFAALIFLLFALCFIALLLMHRNRTTVINTPAYQARPSPSQLVLLSSPTLATPTRSNSAPPVTYKVRPGDSLTTIANLFHIKDVQAFYLANRRVIGDNRSLIRPGQVLHLTIGM